MKVKVDCVPRSKSCDYQSTANMSLSRFKGSLVGAVVADCIGAVYENLKTVKTKEVLSTVAMIEESRQIQKERGTRPADQYCYCFTDDTAMARSVAASLHEKQKFDAPDMGRRFADEYFKEPGRGYGGNIVTVFSELRNPDLTDMFEPARNQFDGSGSYGNGGAMRIAPAALFAYPDNDISKLVELVKSVTRLTHSHPHAVNGAILQALAVDLSLRLPAVQRTEGDYTVLDLEATDKFLDTLIGHMEPLEEEASGDMCTGPTPAKKRQQRKLDLDPKPYCAKLKRIKEFLRQDELNTKEVVEELGNDVSALGSVPAAVLAFLRAANRSIFGVEERNNFQQTIILAISFGGDTDTIATMAAAMAGALYGIEDIPEPWQYYSEGVAEAETIAEHFYSRVKSSNCDDSSSPSHNDANPNGSSTS